MLPADYGLRPVDFTTGAVPADAGALTRRSFVVTAVASGFALASSPLLAQAITTDSHGLVAGPVTVPVAGGEIPAYRAMPATPGPFPTVVVVEEIFGVHEHIQDVCRRFAKLGYFAIAPELFSREGDVAKMTDIGEILKNVIAKVPDAQVMADIDATLAYASGTRHANVARLGIIGFCWGGRTVWLYSNHNPKVKAGVAYYGLLEGMKSDIKPQDPIDVGESLKVPVLGLYAELDGYIKAPVVDAMQAALVKSGSGSRIVVFPGVNHGFNADYRPTYDRTAAEYAWKLTRDWLKERGV